MAFSHAAHFDHVGEYVQAFEHWTTGNEMSPQMQRVVDKLPSNYLSLGLIASAFPNATIIHCWRDPRDICLSCYGQLFDAAQLQLSTSELSWLAQQYHDYARLMQHWHRVLPGRITDVDYERLVQNPEVQWRRLLKACKLPWSANCLTFHRKQRTVQTASVVQVRQPLYQSSRGRWIKYETQSQPLSDVLKNWIADYDEVSGLEISDDPIDGNSTRKIA